MPLNIFSKPGSRTIYTSAPREGLPLSSDCPKDVAPNSYDVKFSSFTKLNESLPPFDNTSKREFLKKEKFPGPTDYDAFLTPNLNGPLMGEGERFLASRNETPGPGPVYILKDPWRLNTNRFFDINRRMRPRVDGQKYISNNAPSMFPLRDIRTFVEGGDGRAYPWRCPKFTHKMTPGPKYNTFGIYTSLSHKTPTIDFSKNAKRGNIFMDRPGFTPGDFSEPLNPNGGLMLSKNFNDPLMSIPRCMESIIINGNRKPTPGPAAYSLLSDFDKEAPKAVSAPFKSTVPTLGFVHEIQSPCPPDHFKSDMEITDLEEPLWPYSLQSPPQHPPFNNGENRFFSTQRSQTPSPSHYKIYGFTDELRMLNCRHREAVRNPKLGFLTSADQRLRTRDGCNENCSESQRPVKNRERKRVRPLKKATYPYHGPPPKYPSSPGPIYDAEPGSRALKEPKSWFYPRHWTGTGFNNSGCSRKFTTNSASEQSPGPIYSVAPAFPASTSGVVMRQNTIRLIDKEIVSPPTLMLHDKAGSMWRATHLGTYNSYLKGIGGIRPSAGGFHPHGDLDNLADKERGYLRAHECLEGVINQKKLNV